MSRSIQRITLLVVVGILVSYPSATATVAAQPPTISSTEIGKLSAAHATQLAEERDEKSKLSEELDAALSAAPLETGLSEALSVGGEKLGKLTQVVAETPLGDVGPELLVAAGYNRRSESSALDNDTREALYDAVRKSSGSYLSELASELDVSVSTVRYHARILENHRVVSLTEIGGKHRLYPAGETDPAVLAALDEESTARILHGVERLGPVTVADLATDLGLADSTVSYHLKRLDDNDVVTRERNGRQVFTELTPSAAAVVGTDRDTLGSL
jgi:DNA-binding transcriptional ArsR family regulator